MSHFTVNLALNKPAYQQYPFIIGDGRVDASNAVDGRKSELEWQEGLCAVSAMNKQTATWWVNLTTIHSIHHITIYYLMNTWTWGRIFNMFILPCYLYYYIMCQVTISVTYCLFS